MKNLNEILSGLSGLEVKGSTDIPVTGIAFDSRKVQPGFLFVAVPGTQVDGHQFINNAINDGAVAIVCERMPENPNPGVAWVQCRNSALILGEVASRFYGEPSAQMKVVGVTGTNGKTTIATLLYQLFRMLGYKTGLLSTICNYVDDKKRPSTHTTPDPVQIHELMAEMVEAGCNYCFMEVSSHAIHQQRIAGIQFDGGIFTNLTHDHLDYHKTFIEYRNAKKLFFDGLGRESFALTNVDDKNGRVMLQNTAAQKLTYSMRSLADFRVKVLESHFDGMLLNVNGTEVWSHFIGNFNAMNLLAVYGTAISLGAEKVEVLRQMSLLKPVDGRFEIIRSPLGVFAIVDYAHTPDALKNVLSSINEIRTRNETLFTVVGAGGDRDKTKRPEMAHEAASASDRVVLTADNPRSEDPEEIIADMMKGLEAHQRNKVLAISNRGEAIRAAAMMARPGDIILVAGKGHETYQEIKGVKHHFDDREVIREIFGVTGQN
ncbi:UDP-N-acetylmuramoyl-L-alanyl-D-glutamate--2,6-diaminopimelate ligase [Prolixibacter sp. SD074]|uniref:UDP-N-acetylmuramoyl-L-alanyl-D-glutamate--2, 6-diaminopimelate ligase n=1 Tax=Prolixibacter sp. SD074 TaxID=2652391 RepID=UPI00127AB687|nr:UDP-N-acetylmuramoyl-L-alanyl-D-glutamate--2,6-diaminopimelate ligase [Prolixibacter sp. SD074]GET30139.1 UDP-N-acetylmuramoyl-L-alanyl-D-glutamate--2,6-diaminopimelate ligase [Prolixibacter sp. SD074]